jgi:hypothetical protein
MPDKKVFGHVWQINAAVVMLSEYAEILGFYKIAICLDMSGQTSETGGPKRRIFERGGFSPLSNPKG